MFGEAERAQAKVYVFSNIFGNLRIAVESTEKFTPMEDKAAYDSILKITSPDEEVPPKVDQSNVELIKTIWNDPGFQLTWKQRANFQVQDSLRYYVEEIDRIAQNGYIPNEADILRSRVRTTGIQEESYTIDGVEFVMFDVGGQRNERKKWIHCFDQVTAVIFVAAMSEYNQTLYEDNSVNRIEEALALFEEVCNSKWFKQTAMILFLNKSDLFKEKLFEFPLKEPGVRFDDYTGPNATPDMDPESPEFAEVFKAAAAYVESLFLARNKQQNKEIYRHITCATDTRNVEVVFNACKDIILKLNLKGSGFM